MHRTLLSASFAALLLIATAVFAEDVSVDASASAEAQVQKPGLPRPFELLHKAQEAKRAIQQGAFQAKQELRVETKAALQGASTTGEKRDILINAAKERVGIAKERIASSTELRMNIKEAIRWHGGLIRERFVNAIAHLKKFMTRIDSRVDKMEAAGVDVSSVTILEVSANTAIATAETDIAAVKTYIESVNDTSDRAAVKTELEAKIKKAQASIRAAHDAVQKVVKALVALAKANKPQAGASADVEVGATTTGSTN